MQIKPLNDMWVVVDKNNIPLATTIKPTSRESKDAAYTLTGLTGGGQEICGYRCVRVDISFTIKE